MKNIATLLVLAGLFGCGGNAEESPVLEPKYGGPPVSCVSTDSNPAVCNQ